MLRHKKTVHDDENGKLVNTEKMNVSDNDSDSESPSENDSRDVDDDPSSSDDDGTENPWSIIMDLTFQKWQPEYSERVQSYIAEEGTTINAARNRAFRDMRDKYRKTMAKTFTDMIIWYRALKKDPIYKAIKKTASDLELMNDYDSKEAWQYAISRRKYLFGKVLKTNEPPEIAETASVQQHGTGKVIQKSADGPLQLVERWVESELERKKNQPRIVVIGKRY